MYYTINQDRVVFSSEIKSLLKLDCLKRELDNESLLQFLALRYVLPPKTLIKNINKVRPGTYLVIDEKGKVKNFTYFSYTIESDQHYSFDDFIEKKNKLENLLFESVETRLNADIEVGLFLSGGVDSTLLLSIANQISKKNINTFSFGVKNIDTNDSNSAADTAKKFKTNHLPVIYSFDEVFDHMKDIDKVLDEPIGDRSVLPMYLVSKEAKKTNKAMISGDGADELFGGYKRYPLLFDKEKDISASKKIEFNHRMIHYLHNFLPSVMLNKKNQSTLLKKLDRYSILFNKLVHPSQILKEFDFNTYLQGSILSKLDICTMKNSIESRCPFLSIDILNFTKTLPIEYCINYSGRKIMLIEILKKYLPLNNLLMGKKKVGFGIVKFFTDPRTKAYLEDYIKKNIQCLGKKINLVLQNSNFDTFHGLWTLYILIKWTKNNLKA